MSAAPTYNIADLWESVVDAVPDREALVCGGRRLTFAEVDERATRLANAFLDRGVQPGQHVGVLLHNGTEYLESMLAAYKVRAAPINVNFRYVADELRYLFDDADLVGLVHHRQFTPRVAEAATGLEKLSWFIGVDDGTDDDLAAVGAVPYEEAIAAAPATRGFAPRSDDDPYVTYTGGTTGMPKGVVWRLEDAFFACFGGGDPYRILGPVQSTTELLERLNPSPMTYLPAVPLMHAAGTWTVLLYLLGGNRVVLLPGSLDPDLLWRTVREEQVNLITVVGDAVLRPLLDAYDAAGGAYDASTLLGIGSGGAPLSTTTRERAVRTLPNVVISDGYGSSETGIQATARYNSDDPGGAGSTFHAETAVVLDPATLEPVGAGSAQVGQVARTGRIPVGYWKDPEKTAATFVEYDGRRWAMSGDMATVEADGSVTVLGRGSSCINTGGEKVFPEEVEGTLRAHPDVYDVVVAGAPDERWGQRVVAVVQLTEGAAPDAEALRSHCRASLAGYKVPKHVVFVPEVVRSPAGKADYRWAASVAADAPAGEPVAADG